MMRRMLTVAVAAMLCAAPLRAGIITVPLELGEIPWFLQAGEVVLLPFDAGRPLVNVSQVGVHLTGAGTFNRNFCWNEGDFGGGVWYHRDVLGLEAGLKQGSTLLAGTTLSYDPAVHPADIGVNLDLVLVLDGDDWSCLADGTGTVALRGLECGYFPSYPEVCVCDESMVLTAVSLVVATDGSLPAAPAAWGAFKARYRP